jgi:phosphate transport system substrate-binding protein
MTADPGLPAYRAPANLSGTLTCAGSSTVARILQPVVRCFRDRHPRVAVTLVGAGSGSGPPALIDGSAQVALMSRPFKTEECAAATRKQGGTMVGITIAVDALAVYVRSDNPLAGITLTQLDGIISSSRLRGSPPIERWGQLGLDGAWSERRITAFGFKPSAGGFTLVQDVVLKGGDYAADLSREHVSSSIVQGVASEPGGLGISSIFLRTPTTRTVPVGIDGPPFFEPTRAHCLSGDYPLMRRLQMWVRRGPDGIAEPARSFLRFACSAEGQEIIANQGEFSLDVPLAKEQLAAIGE